jgi:hypothetical protein
MGVGAQSLDNSDSESKPIQYRHESLTLLTLTQMIEAACTSETLVKVKVKFPRTGRGGS